MNKIVEEFELYGKTYRLETGELAKQASGSVLVTQGETMKKSSLTGSSSAETVNVALKTISNARTNASTFLINLPPLFSSLSGLSSKLCNLIPSPRRRIRP